MKRKVMSLLLAMVTMLCVLPIANAAENHTYYSQYGNINTSVDSKLCYLTCMAMMISDLGNHVTPSDVYKANGNTAYTDWGKLRTAYGVNVTETPLKVFDVATQKSKIVNLLNSGNYPQGLMLTIRYGENSFHAVVARKVVNNTIYCDDPAKGCCIPLENCSRYTSTGTYAGILSYRVVTKSSSWTGNSGGSTGGESAKPTSYADCLVEIACFNGQIVNLYNNPGDSSRVTYFSKGQDSRSDYSATLGDGSTWYRVIAVHNGEARTFWLKYEPNKMTVTPINPVQQEPSASESTIRYADCNVEITCFSGYIVNLYDNPGDSSRVTYFSKGQTARSLYCATLSDGSTWYKIHASHQGDINRVFWLKYEPDKMWVTTITPTHTIHFNANGGSVSISSKQVKAGGTYGELPNPTRDGYIFDGWYTGINGGKQINFFTTVDLSSDQITLYAHWTSLYTDNSSNTNTGYWGSWSGWSTNYVEAIPHVRMVETRQVKVSDEHIEYRYGRFIDSTGTKVCWCSRYLESWSSVSGSAMLDYSDWSTTQYSPAKPHWTCGFCKGNHINVDHYTSDGRAWWKQYILPGGSYYWEETRTVEAQYETQYSYREWIPG